jgi:branched-chain amino acid transport system permease protein
MPPLALLFILVTTDRYLLGVAVLICIAGLQALSLNYVWGWGGQFSMGQIALSAIAAYASALLVLQYQANVWLALVLATGLTVTVAVLLGAVGLRFRGMHFAVITLAFGQVVILGLNNWPAVGGPSGLSIPYSIPSLPVISALTPTQQYLVLGVSMLAVASILTKLFLNTATGRAITAVRDEELLAAAVGIPAASMKVIAFEPGRSFTLETSVVPLSRFQFTCRVEPAGDKTRVSQSVRVVGPMGWLFDPMMGDQIAKDFDTVLDGLVKKVEADS